MRQIVRTDEKFLRQKFQRKLAGVVPVDVAGHGVDLLGDGIAELPRAGPRWPEIAGSGSG